MSKKVSKSKWLAFAALLMFVGATFQIANNQFIPGIICFCAAASFTASANVYRGKEKNEKEGEVDDK